jgi:hypothetical protein
MNNDLQNKQLTLLNSGVPSVPSTRTAAAGESLLEVKAGTPPALTKGSRLPEGWHMTEKYGEVYVNPGGIAWTIQRDGDELVSVSVQITKEDITQKPSADRVKRNLSDRQRRKTKVVNASRPILTASGAGVATEGVLL